MITLFEPNETSFTHNGLGNLDKNIIDPVIEEDLNGIFSLAFEYPIFALHGLEIDGQSIIRAPVPEGPDQLFRVYKPTKAMGYLKVECYHVFYDLIDNFIEDTNIVGKEGQTALAQMGSKTQYAHNFRFFSDITTVAGSRIVRKNPVEFLLDDSLDNSFVNRWGGELKRNNFDVSMYNSIGSDKGVTIRHKKDLLGYEAVVDWHSPVTRIMPIGFDGLLLPEKYVDSPVINSYIKPKIQKIEYGDIKAAIGQYADDKEAIPLEQAYAELRKLAKLEYSKGKIDYPKASYKVEFVTLSKTEEYKDYISLETVALGDTVTIIHSEDNLDIKAKVIKYRFDPLVKKYIDIELGNFKERFSDTQGKIDSIYNHVEEIKQDLSLTIQVSADGKNTIYRGVPTPVNARVGDLWYKPIDNGNTEMYIYTNDPIDPWYLMFSTASLDEVSKEVDTVIADIIIEKERIDGVIVKADQAIIDAGFAGVDATEAKANAVTALEKANTAKTNADKAIADVGVMNPKVTKAVADAAAAVTNANTAKTNAETALDTAKTGLTNSTNALDKAGQALTKATATETATGSLTTSHDALAKTVGLKADKTELDKVNGKVTQHGLDITANATEIGVKADKSVVDTINKTVTAHSLAIKATADSLASKAEKTLVDSLSGTVATHSTTLTQTAKDIALKADSTEVNAIKGTVDTHSTAIATNAAGLLVKAEKSEVNNLTGKVTSNTNAIGVNATAITARLTSTQVDSLVSAKNYVNETQLNATADGIKLEVSSIETELNEEIGEVSLRDKTEVLQGTEIYTDKSDGAVVHVDVDGVSVQDGEPTPDYPIPIESLNNFDIVSSVSGRNLLPNSSSEEKLATLGIWWSPLQTERNLVPLEHYRVKVGDTITYKVFIKPTDTTAWARTGCFYEDGGYSAHIGNKINVGDSGYSSVTFVVPKNSVKLTVAVDHGVAGTTGTKVYYKEEKLELGSTATPYSQAPEDILPDAKSPTLYKTNITLPEPLRSVGDVKDRLFRDNDGLWKIERNIWEQTFTSVLQLYSNYPVAGMTKFRIDTESKNSLSRDKGDTNIICNMLPTLTINEGFRGESVGISGYSYVNNQNIFYGAMPTSNLITNDVSGLNAFFAQNPITIQFHQETPTTETLSQEFQTKLNNIQSFKGSNYVYTLHDKSGIFSPNLNATFKSIGWYKEFILGDSLDSLNSKVTENSSAITIASDKIESKVSKTDFDILEGKQSATRSQVTQTAQGLLSKAESTVVDAMKGTVDTHTTQIVQTNKDIALKADSSVVNTISGKVTANSSAITANATAIGLRLTSAQVESAITGKKYVNETQLKATSDGLTANISSTNTELGKSNTRITNVEATANGLQTTVLNKADKSQITQLAGQISSKVESKDYNSKMTQLDSAINLRVQKGDIIGQINVEAGKTLIQNKTIYLDAATVTFSGKAFIPSASITSLTVDKLNGGTANFANFNAININASSITTGIIKGTNLSLNLGTGEVVFQKGLIKKYDDSLIIDVDKGRIESYNRQGGITLENGSLKMYKTPVFIDPTSANTFYGSVDYVYDMFGGKGVALTGTNGAILRSGAYSVPLVGTAKGAGMYVEGGSATVESEGIATIKGGNEISQWTSSGIYVGANRTNKNNVGADILMVSGGYRLATSSNSVGMEFLGNGILSLKSSIGIEYFKVGPLSGDYGTTTVDFAIGGDALAHRKDGTGLLLYSKSAYYRTYSNAPNMFITSYGTIGRSTSASKYKLNISEIKDIENYSKKVLELKPKQWFDRTTVEGYVSELQSEGEYKNADEQPIIPSYGLIAEDLVELGLEKYVQYGEDGKEVEGIMYDRLWTLLIPIVKEQQEKLELQQEQINQLMIKINV